LRTEETKTYPNEKDANFALFHFASSVDAIEKLVTEGINKASADEIEQYQDKAKESEDRRKVNFLANPEWTCLDPNLSPPKALCCSLAISSPVQEDQLKIKFYNNHSVNFKGVGVVIEDPKKVLVPHADYYAYRSGGILPFPLTKGELLGFKDFKIKGDGLRKRDEGLEKPVRMGVMARIHLGVDSVTNYASWSREEKRVLENRGGENGFLNFAKNFYRTSMCGKSRHDNHKLGRENRKKYYLFDSQREKRQEASYTELLVYQKTGEENPIAGVVLDMKVLTLNRNGLNNLKQLFRTNPNLALYIYDTRLENDCIRKIEDKTQIQDYLDFIGTNAKEEGTVLKFSSDEIAQKNQSLSVFDNKILATDDLAPAPAPAPTPALAPKPKNPKEIVSERFKVFYSNLNSKDKTKEFLKFLWGGGNANDDYDNLKIALAEQLKETYTGDNDAEKKRKALQLINEVNRERAIEKLMELNSTETDSDKKLRTENYIATYRQIYRQHKLDIFLEQDEFDLGKKEMATFATSEGGKSGRLKEIDKLKDYFEGKNKIEDTEILSFFSSLSSAEVDSKKALRKIWKGHNDEIENYEDNLKNVARRDFLLLAIDAMENQGHKARLAEHVKSNYRNDSFLDSFGGLARELTDKDKLPLLASALPPPPAPAPVSAPPPVSAPVSAPAQAQLQSPQQPNDIAKSTLYGALIGAGVGFGVGLCVSALGAGIVLSAPLVATALVGAAIGVGVGAVAGLASGVIENARAIQVDANQVVEKRQ